MNDSDHCSAQLALPTSATPTILKLVTMKRPDGEPLRIIESIAASDYKTFGMFLLQDENGVAVSLIEKDHINKGLGAGDITRAILQKWLTSSALTHTYQHLIACLRQSGLGVLADLIVYKEDLIVSPTFDEAESYLKRAYMSLSLCHTSQHWTHLPRCEFIQLAMIRSWAVRHGGPEEKVVRLAQQGKVEVILSQKRSVSLEEALINSCPDSSPPPPPPPSPSLLAPIPHQENQCYLPDLSVLPIPSSRVTLIEGAPGGGKSTLVLHICKKWAHGVHWLARFNIVVLAYLRDEAIQNACTLADIIPVDTRDVSEKISSHIQATYGLSVLFVFDGWDEFPLNLQKKSLVSTIIKEPYKLSLHQSYVLITTRPSASGNLFHIADRRVEILGFTHVNIVNYITKSLDGSCTNVQQLVNHLKENPILEGYCYIPLHAAILVHVFLTKKGILPITLHELFCDLVLCCIVRELETHDTMISADLSSLDDLPAHLKSQLNDLCILAYEGVIQNKVIFYQEDLQACHLPIDLPSLGLLQVVEGLTLFNKSLSYNFLHISVQYLLAAYHISQMTPHHKQVAVLKKLKLGSHFQAVLQYYCGFAKVDTPAVIDLLTTD